VLFGVLGRHEAAVTPRGYANAVEAMQELCSNTEREGVTIGLEVVNRYESDVLNTTEQGLRFLSDIGSANATLHLGTYHMNIEEPGMAEAIELAGDRLGYDGTITFESFSSAVVSPALTRALCIWRETWDDGMELAVSARQFVLDHLAAATA
jgi:D-psicose/D-tagatose/L-ribulose 3-epimerase